MRNLLVLCVLLFQIDGFAGLNGSKTQETLNEQLLYDIRFHPLEYVKQSILVGADANASHSRNITALHHAVVRSIDFVELLLNNGADPNLPNDFGDISLHDAARFSKDPKIFRVLLENGANAQSRNNRGYIPLQVAENFKNAKAISVLKKYACRISFQ